MEATYKTLYSDVGRKSLEVWLRLGCVRRFRTCYVTIPTVGAWLVALRAYDGIAYLYKAYDTQEQAERVAHIVSARSSIWRCAEVWHVVDGIELVEHVLRESDGKLLNIRWVSLV